MKRLRKRMMAGALAVTMLAGLFGMSEIGIGNDQAEAAEIPVRETTQAAAKDNQVIIGVLGTDYTSAQ